MLAQSEHWPSLAAARWRCVIDCLQGYIPKENPGVNQGLTSWF